MNLRAQNSMHTSMAWSNQARLPGKNGAENDLKAENLAVAFGDVLGQSMSEARDKTPKLPVLSVIAKF